MVYAGILLAAVAAFFMASFYEYGKRVGYGKGLEKSKLIFENFKANELEYVSKKDVYDYLDQYVDDDGNKLPDWYPILIVKPEAMEIGLETLLKGE